MINPPLRERVPPNTQLLEQLRTRFGERFTTSRALLEQHGQDESFHPGFPPDAVVFAKTTQEISDTVKLCASLQVPMIPFGTGTSLEGHIAALRGGICIDVSQMDAILRVSPEDLDCSVQPGVTREQLNESLRATGLFFPIDPGANASLGGMAATRCSGTNAVRYGTMRENVLALEVVMADGSIVRTARRARKSSAGYDLTRIFVGSEGTLGIITELTLKLYGIPESISAAVCSFPSLEAAVNTVVMTIQLGVQIARIELLDDGQMNAVNQFSKTHYPVADTLFFEFHGSSAGIAEQAEIVKGIAEDLGGIGFQRAANPEERNKLWKARHDAYNAARALRPGAKGWVTDVCVPVSRLTECILETKKEIAQSAVPSVVVGHVGDGNFHAIFLLNAEDPAEVGEVERLNHALVMRALAMDGTCTGEHGVGWGKMGFLPYEFGESGLAAMRTLKKAFDPMDIMNPGKIVAL